MKGIAMPGPGGDDAAAKQDWLTGAFGMGGAFAALGNAAATVAADAHKAVKTVASGGGTPVSGDDPSDLPPVDMADDDMPRPATTGGGNPGAAAEQGAGDDPSDRPVLEEPLDTPPPGVKPIVSLDRPPDESDEPQDDGGEFVGIVVGDAASSALFKPQDPIHPSQNDPVEPPTPPDPAVHENPITVENRGQTSWSLIENSKAAGASGNAANALPDGSDAGDLVNVAAATLKQTVNHTGSKGSRLQFDLVITAEGGTLPDAGGHFLRSVKAMAARVVVTGGRKVSAEITFQKPQADPTWTTEMSWEVSAVAMGQAISDANWSATISGNVIATKDKPLIVYYGEKSLADIDAD